MNKLVYPSLFLVFSLLGSCADEPGQNRLSKTGANVLDPSLMALFDTVNVVKMHVFSSDSDANYPYGGKAVDNALLTYLDSSLQPGENGSVHACYWLENDNSYIVRVSRDGASNSILLARADAAAKKLLPVRELAGYSCAGSTCTRIDSWLIDLDDDRDLELIELRQTLGAQGEPEEQFTVFAKNANGNYEPADELLASLAVRDYYVPSKPVQLQ